MVNEAALSDLLNNVLQLLALVPRSWH